MQPFSASLKPGLPAAWRAVPLILLAAALLLAPTVCRADDPDDQDSGAQVQTRGPVHEAFAAVIAFKPEPGMVVPKEPPDIIEEVPPDQKPEGENVTWIPGYWAWDDERADFLWVSGVWRALPPGRQWVAGYWAKSGDGYQWTSGYWSDAAEDKTTYLPAPPATIESGPSVAAPSLDYVWIPGCWIWRGHYVWRAGYWVAGRDDWAWSPDYYVWTPHGYVFVDGYWDYPVERRGVLFAPVYFEPGWRGRPHYAYRPAIVIDLGVFSDHLFVRPGYRHYYFGDYYAVGYRDRGFYAAFSFQSRGYGYDPIYSHERWEHRQDRQWDQRVQANYRDRRDHDNVRPPRTWVPLKGSSPPRGAIQKAPAPNNNPVARRFDQVSKGSEGSRRFQALTPDEKQRMGQRGQDVQKWRDGRKSLEAGSAGAARPSTLELPKSPIASSPANAGRDKAPPRLQKPPRGQAGPGRGHGPQGGQGKMQQRNGHGGGGERKKRDDKP